MVPSGVSVLHIPVCSSSLRAISQYFVSYVFLALAGWVFCGFGFLVFFHLRRVKLFFKWLIEQVKKRLHSGGFSELR